MNKILSIMIMVCMISTSQAQSGFEDRIKDIKKDIQIIKDQEKETLRMQVEEVNQRLDKKEISSAEASEQKKALAEKCADRIEARIEPLEREIQNLIQNEVHNKDNRIKDLDDMDDNKDADTDRKNERNRDPDDMDDDNDHRTTADKDGININWKFNGRNRKTRGEPRTTTQFVFAFGLNNIISNDDLSTIDESGIKFSNSRFYEWGWTWKTRLAQESPFLQLKYGLSFTYNNLRPEDNKYYVKNGKTTVLAIHPQTLTDEPYFRTINMVVPVHMEFDFSKKRMRDDKTYVRSQKGFRLGVGGYAGINLRTKQLLEYKADGLETEQVTKGNYNTSDFIYGLSGYIGYKDISLYTKYDLNPLFSDNTLNQNNISIGLRFDFN
ncbi:MAG: hypothetical protein WAU01_04855 [Saprospiraceae bacterium]